MSVSIDPAHPSVEVCLTAPSTDTTPTALPLPAPLPINAHPDDHRGRDGGLTSLLAGSWNAEQFSEMELAIRQWAKRSAGFQIVHDSKDITHDRTCRKAKHNKDSHSDSTSSDTTQPAKEDGTSTVQPSYISGVICPLCGNLLVCIWYPPGTLLVSLRYNYGVLVVSRLCPFPFRLFPLPARLSGRVGNRR